MKVFAAGMLVAPGSPVRPAEAMRYVLSLPGVSTVVIGCRSPAEVEANVTFAQQFQQLNDASMRELEQRCQAREADFSYFKRS